MAIIYKGPDSKIFYVVERYSVDQNDWVRYTNTMGEEFTCLKAAFEERFIKMEQ